MSSTLRSIVDGSITFSKEKNNEKIKEQSINGKNISQQLLQFANSNEIEILQLDYNINYYPTMKNYEKYLNVYEANQMIFKKYLSINEELAISNIIIIEKWFVLINEPCDCNKKDKENLESWYDRECRRMIFGISSYCDKQLENYILNSDTYLYSCNFLNRQLGYFYNVYPNSQILINRYFSEKFGVFNKIEIIDKKKLINELKNISFNSLTSTIKVPDIILPKLK